MKNKKILTAAGKMVIIAFVLAIVATVIYYHSSTTGYMAGQNYSMYPLYLSGAALLLMLVTMLGAKHLPNNFAGVLMFLSVACLAASVCMFVDARQQLFADVYFIPVNYPESEGTALYEAMAGMAAYILSALLLCFAGFSGTLAKEPTAKQLEKAQKKAEAKAQKKAAKTAEKTAEKAE